MKQILLISHGGLAEGIYETARMICGELPNVSYLSLKNNMGIDQYQKALEKEMERIKNAEEIVILADLKGGSPYTAAATLLARSGLLNKAKLISGLNLPMLLTVLFQESRSDEGLEKIINAAREGISVFRIGDESDDDSP